MPITNKQAAAHFDHVNRPARNYGADDAFADWKLNGTCSTNPDLGVDDFYDLKHKSHDHIQMLRDVCAACPEREKCYELARKEPYGFLAGMTEDERKKLRGREKRHRYVDKKRALEGKPPRDRVAEDARRAEKRRIAKDLESLEAAS